MASIQMAPRDSPAFLDAPLAVMPRDAGNIRTQGKAGCASLVPSVQKKPRVNCSGRANCSIGYSAQFKVLVNLDVGFIPYNRQNFEPVLSSTGQCQWSGSPLWAWITGCFPDRRECDRDRVIENFSFSKK